MFWMHNIFAVVYLGGIVSLGVIYGVLGILGIRTLQDIRKYMKAKQSAQ